LEGTGINLSLSVEAIAVEKLLFNPTETVEYLGGIVTPKTMAEWRSSANRGRGNPGPKFIRIGGKIAYRKADLDRWMLINEIDSDAAPKPPKKK
jgi:hypothetical protein